MTSAVSYHGGHTPSLTVGLLITEPAVLLLAVGLFRFLAQNV
jgi:hypothetical protein